MELRICENCGLRVAVTREGICPSCRVPLSEKSQHVEEMITAPSPAIPEKSSDRRSFSLPRRKLTLVWPGSALAVLSAVALVIEVVLTTRFVRDAWQRDGYSGAGLSLALNGSIILAHVITFYGAICMLRLRSYSFARASAILSALPCSTPLMLLGIPFGIWALVLLAKPQLKDAFASRDKN